VTTEGDDVASVGVDGAAAAAAAAAAASFSVLASSSREADGSFLARFDRMSPHEMCRECVYRSTGNCDYYQQPSFCCRVVLWCESEGLCRQRDDLSLSFIVGSHARGEMSNGSTG
jgi:hypothetical protein